MGRLIGALLIGLIAVSAQAQDEGSLKVLTQGASIKENPEGQLLETVERGAELKLNNLFKFWAKG